MAERSFIGLHAGAHFAGAETFNRYLAANRAAIEAAGLAPVAPHSPFDAGWTDAPLPGAGTAVADLPGFAAALTAAMRPATGPGMRGLVLSRPDLAGSVAEVVSGSFFRSAGLRGAALRLALGRPVD
ncbi:MAG: hypothetical protein K2X91_06850, partial [Thermoleophilia bacterium]|nr:hypothetical protein [Thermoleophilia bacterium]